MVWGSILCLHLLPTLYDIISRWWYTLIIMSKISVKHELFSYKKLVESPTMANPNVMEWSRTCPLCLVMHQVRRAQPIIGAFTWHNGQGLDHNAIVCTYFHTFYTYLNVHKYTKFYLSFIYSKMLHEWWGLTTSPSWVSLGCGVAIVMAISNMGNAKFGLVVDPYLV
jgi:hypothetical protein